MTHPSTLLLPQGQSTMPMAVQGSASWPPQPYAPRDSFPVPARLAPPSMPMEGMNMNMGMGMDLGMRGAGMGMGMGMGLGARQAAQTYAPGPDRMRYMGDPDLWRLAETQGLVVGGGGMGMGMGPMGGAPPRTMAPENVGPGPGPGPDKATGPSTAPGRMSPFGGPQHCAPGGFLT
jgi:hypothetical protein